MGYCETASSKVEPTKISKPQNTSFVENLEFVNLGTSSLLEKGFQSVYSKS